MATTRDNFALESYRSMAELQRKGDAWERKHRLLLDQNNAMISGRGPDGRSGDYFASMSESEKSVMNKWEQSGALKAYPNPEERKRAWLMYRKGTVDVRRSGTLLSDEEYKRHMVQAKLQNPYFAKLKDDKAKMWGEVGKNAVPSTTKLRETYRKQNAARKDAFKSSASGGGPVMGEDGKYDLRTMKSTKGPGIDDAEMSPLEKLYDEYQKKTDEANEKNEARYKQIEKQYQDRHMRGVEDIKGWENSELLKNKEKWDEDRGNLTAKYESNTSVGDAFQARANRDERMANTDIRSDAQGRRVAMDMSLDQDLAQFRERREDVAPDMNVMMKLAQAMGQGNNGLGFSGQATGAEGLDDNGALPGSGGSAGSMQQNAGKHYQPQLDKGAPIMRAGGPARFSNQYQQSVQGFFGANRSNPASVYSRTANTPAFRNQIRQGQRQLDLRQQQRNKIMQQQAGANWWANDTGHLTASQRMQRDAIRRGIKVNNREAQNAGDQAGQNLINQGF